MKKQMVSVMMAAMMAASLVAGCSSQEKPASQPAETTTAAAGTQAESVEKETEAAKEKPDFTPAAELKAPEGKSLAVLPVDQKPDKEVRIATIGMNTNPFDSFVYEGMVYAGEVLKDRNCKVDFMSIKEHNITELEKMIRNCLAAGYDAITVNGFGEQLQPLLTEAKEQGVTICTFNNPSGDNPEDGDGLSFWGQSGFDGGASLGKMACEKLGGKGKYAIITGNFSLSGHEQRRLGFRSVADTYEGMELVGEYENKDLYESAYELATNLITANPDLKCIYVTAGGPGGAAQAIEDAGKSGEIVMVCHDWMPDTIPFVRSGVISGVLDQEPFTQGYAPVIDAFNYVVGGVTPEKVNMIEGQIATPENVNELIPE